MQITIDLKEIQNHTIIQLNKTTGIIKTIVQLQINMTFKI